MTIISAAILLGLAVGIGVGFQKPLPAGSEPDLVAAPQPQPQPQIARVAPDETVIEADSRGHYYTDAEVNGETIRFLVDTGATMVALSRDDAARVGFRPGPAEFTHRANTANGIARVAPVIIDEIEIGDISVRDVRGAVMDIPMRHSLLGMSFLTRLSGYEVRDRQLILRP